METKTAPEQLIELVTSEVLAKIAHHRELVDSDSDEQTRERLLRCFFDDVEMSLGKVVDFDWIALNVMGPYRKVASEPQKSRFAETFRAGLVETYGRGLLSYSNQEIVLIPRDGEIGERRRVSVRQEIRGEDANYPLEYTMGLSQGGEWKVINVIINGINLGKTFRNQFVQASQKHGGDLDQVIANWDSGLSES